jgi:peptide/nickel transport system substrate-binding protein
MEMLRLQYARESEPTKQKLIAEAIQIRVTEWTTLIHLGQRYPESAARKNITGSLSPGLPVF